MAEVEGITITGSGAVAVQPDVVVVDLGVDVREADISTAMLTAEEALERARQALVERGVQREDLRSTQASLWREDRTDDRGQRTETVVHYTLGLAATLRDIGGSGEDIHAALTAAGDCAQMTSLTFSVAEPQLALAQARAAAFDDAFDIAQTYAQQAGRTLGRVLTIVDAPTAAVPRMAKLADRAEFAVEPGRQQIGASVTVTWAFAQD